MQLFFSFYSYQLLADYPLVPLLLYQPMFYYLESANIVVWLFWGTLMILIPGAYFVNAIREFTQNNYYSGLALMLSGVSTCLSISVGVLAMISLLPFVEQLSGMFSTPSTSWQEVLIQTFMAGLGDSSLLRALPSTKEILLRPRNPRCRLMVLYLLIWNNTHHEVLAILFPCPSGHIHLTLFFWPTTVDVQLQSS